jgi:speckle-type POZ protein
LESLESGNEGDACFKVGQKTFTVMKHLISRRAPALGDMAASQPPGSVIPIDNVNPEVFGVILHFIYTDETPESTDPRSVLEVADRFGCSHLKLIAEAEIVKAGVDKQNAAELLLFADAYSCALLREAAREFCVTHREAITESSAWQQLKESTDLSAELVVGTPTQFSDSNYGHHASLDFVSKTRGQGSGSRRYS